MKTKLTLHETLELHELLAFKTSCAAKSSQMEELASDFRLRELLKQDSNNAKQQIKEIQNLISDNIPVRGGH